MNFLRSFFLPKNHNKMDLLVIFIALGSLSQDFLMEEKSIVIRVAVGVLYAINAALAMFGNREKPTTLRLIVAYFTLIVSNALVLFITRDMRSLIAVPAFLALYFVFALINRKELEKDCNEG